MTKARVKLERIKHHTILGKGEYVKADCKQYQDGKAGGFQGEFVTGEHDQGNERQYHYRKGMCIKSGIKNLHAASLPD